MKISLNALKNLTPVNVSDEELISMITAQIGEVEEVEKLDNKYKGILVAQIKKKQAHPNADKLAVYTVDTGKKEVQVVAGDKTLEKGDLVAYFPVGVKVPNNVYPEKFDGIVRKTKLRGVESNGMMASAKELNISDNHEVVLRLDALQDGTTPKVGAFFADEYSLNDTVIEVENKALTNRPECFGLIGFAREVAGIQGPKVSKGQQFQTPEWFDYGYNGKKISTGKELNEEVLQMVKVDADIDRGTAKKKDKNVYTALQNSIELKVFNKCPNLVSRYVVVAFKNILVESSPVWLQIELMKAGIKPINNVVDITNYLMILTGQPLHAFDLDKLLERQDTFGGRVVNGISTVKVTEKTEILNRTHTAQENVKIIVRKSKKGEKIATLDNKIHELDGETVVIADDLGPIAIGGVIGGVDTEISVNTKRIIVESANFNMYNLRKTSNKYGLFTEAVTRFSKNQDPNQCGVVLKKSVDMLSALSDAYVASEVVDVKPNLREVRMVEVSTQELCARIGKKIDADKVKQLLEGVELQIELKKIKTAKLSKGDEKDTIIQVQIPTYRQDLSIPEDINEEVIRLLGYLEIRPKLPMRSIAPVRQDHILKIKQQVRDALVKVGSYELLTYSFIGEKLLNASGQVLEDAYHLKNAISPQLEYMRLSLIPSLLNKVRQNHDDGYEQFSFFEINKTHIKNELGEDGLPEEFERVGLVYSATNLFSKQNFSGSSYYQAKKHADGLFEMLNVADIEYEAVSNKKIKDLPVWIQKNLKMYSLKECAVVTYVLHNKKHYLGIIGGVAEVTKRKLKLPHYVSAFEFDLKALIVVSDLGVKYSAVPKYPAVLQDLCLVTDRDVPYTVLVEGLRDGIDDEDLYLDISPVDIYYDSDGSVHSAGNESFIDNDNENSAIGSSKADTSSWKEKFSKQGGSNKTFDTGEEQGTVKSENVQDTTKHQVTLRVKMRHSEKVLSSEEIEVYRKRMLRNVRRMCNAVLKKV